MYYNFLLNMWVMRQITEVNLINAVSKNLIKETEKNTILETPQIQLQEVV